MSHVALPYEVLRQPFVPRLLFARAEEVVKLGCLQLPWKSDLPATDELEEKE